MMALPESISVHLENLDLKKNTMRKAFLTLLVEWKYLDEHLDLTKKCFSDCVTDLNSERENLEFIRESIVESNRKLNLVRESLEARQREVERREDIFFSFQQTQLKDFEMKEEQLVKIRRWVVERMEEVELKNERLSEQKKKMELLLREFQIGKNEYEDIKKAVGEKLKEISLKEKKIDDQSKELSLVQDLVERKGEEVEIREQQLKAMQQCLNDEQKLFEERCNEFESKETQLQEKYKFFDSGVKQYEEQAKDLVLKETQLEECRKEFESKEKKFEEQSKNFDSMVNQFEERSKVLTLKESDYEERCNEFESKEKKLNDILSKQKQVEERSKNSGLKENLFIRKIYEYAVHSHFGAEKAKYKPPIEFPAEIHVVVNLDGLELNISKYFEDHQSLSSEVYKILQLSLDPSELVLDVVEGFHPLHMKKGKTEFKTTAARRSCLILLEQLMELSPQIPPHVKEKALRLAGKWKVNMGVDLSNASEVLAYIQLLASYKLTSNFDANEILQLLLSIPICDKVPKLFGFLGLQEKVLELIERLIKENQHLKAIRYIVTFGLHNMFPPKPLLQEYLRIFNKIGVSENPSREAKVKEIENTMACMEAVIRCIKDNKIECGVWLYTLERKVKGLRKWKGEKTCPPLANMDENNLASSSAASKAQLDERDDVQSEKIHQTRKRKSFISNNYKKNARVHPVSVHPLRSPLCLIPQVGSYCLGSMSRPPSGFGNLNYNFGYPNPYFARAGALLGVQFRPPVADQMHWR